MTNHKDGLDSAGAKPGDKVKCLGQRDERGYPTFMKGQTYTVGTAPLGDPCVWIAPPKPDGTHGACPLPSRGYGFFFEVVK